MASKYIYFIYIILYMLYNNKVFFFHSLKFNKQFTDCLFDRWTANKNKTVSDILSVSKMISNDNTT